MDDLLAGKKHIHFIGVAGIGMSGLAKAVKSFGYFVSGSDMKEGHSLQELRKRGILIFTSHDEKNIKDADLVVYSSAIRENNPEFAAAKAQGITLVRRAQLLAHFMNQGKSIAILGTHGKTTTSSMVSHLLSMLDLHPTCFVGGEMINFQDNVILGEKNWIVGEIDESDGTHLLFSPSHVILTNLELDHADYYTDLDDVKAKFSKFLDNLSPDSTVVYSADCPNLSQVIKDKKVRKISYGLTVPADFSTTDIRFDGLTLSYELVHESKRLGTVRLSIPGCHNILNSLGAIALLYNMGLPLEGILMHLPKFLGARRRLERKWDEPGLLVVDDYAHHPTEVAASLKALKASGRKVTCIFQPHRYSRAVSLAKTFGPSFVSADRVLLTEIYSAGETNTMGIDSSIIYNAVTDTGHPDIHRIAKEEVIDYLLNHLEPNEIIAFLGAGDITEVADRFVESLKARNTTFKKAG